MLAVFLEIILSLLFFFFFAIPELKQIYKQSYTSLIKIMFYISKIVFIT